MWTSLGHTPSTAGTFRKKFRKNSGKTPETLSELFLEFPSRVRLGSPKPYNSRHLRLPERFQNSLPPSTAGGASFFRIGSGEGLSEPVIPVLRAFLILYVQFRHLTPSACLLFRFWGFFFCSWSGFVRQSQGAAKGGRQKEFDLSFFPYFGRFWGHFF